MDTSLWVKENIFPYINTNNDGTFIMPDPEEDIDYFSGLHSWYKHWKGQAKKIYPILRLGLEPRNELCCLSDDEKKEKNTLHWSFVCEDDLNTIEEWEKYGTGYPPNYWPMKMMAKHYVHLSDRFGNGSPEINNFHKLALKRECQEVWEQITEILHKQKVEEG